MTASAKKRPSTVRFAASTTKAPRVAAEVAAVFAGLPSGVINGGEIVILAIKPSMWRPLFDSASWVAASCLLALILATMGQSLPGLSLSATVQLMLLVGFGRLAFAIAQWAPRWHVLTNRRIIDIRGVRCPRIDACPLVSIRNTYVRRPLHERLTGLGTILFVPTEPSAAQPLWRSIHDPEAVHAKIRRAIENALDAQNL